MTLAHHYTTGTCLAGIRNTGILQPADAGIGEGERPVVWFSRFDRWEPTATKLVVDSRIGAMRVATLRELHQLGGGLFRLSIDASRLIAWPALARVADIDRRTRRNLEASAKRQGAYPSLWMGHIGPIPFADIVAVEQIDPSTKQPQQPQQMAA